MKYLLLLPMLTLTSCSLFEAAGTTPSSALADLAAASPKLAAEVASGQYLAAAITVGSLLGGWLGLKGYKRVRASAPGNLGIFSKPEE